jgi:hypothetical protein
MAVDAAYCEMSFSTPGGTSAAGDVYDAGTADEADDTGGARMVQAQRLMPRRQAQLRKLTPRGRGGRGLECRLAAPAELVVAALVDERRLKEFCQKYATVKQFITTWLDYFERSTTLSRAW